MSPVDRVLYDLLYLSRNSAGDFTPHHALRQNDVVVFGPNGIYTSTFWSSGVVEIVQESGWATGDKRSRIKSINIAAGRNSGQVPASSQAQISTSQADKALHFITQRISHVVSPLNMILTLASLYYLSSNRHSHRMSDYVHLFSSRVGKNSFNKRTDLHHILF